MLRTAGASLKPNALAVGGISRTFFSDDVAMLGALVAIAILSRCDLLGRYEHGRLSARLRRRALACRALAGRLTGACAVVYLLLRSRFITDRTTIERYP